MSTNPGPSVEVQANWNVCGGDYTKQYVWIHKVAIPWLMALDEGKGIGMYRWNAQEFLVSMETWLNV